MRKIGAGLPTALLGAGLMAWRASPVLCLHLLTVMVLRLPICAVPNRSEGKPRRFASYGQWS